MFGIGAQEMFVILVVALLVFGPKRLPELARTVGRGLAEFRRASTDMRQAFDMAEEPHKIERPPQPAQAGLDAPLGDEGLGDEAATVAAAAPDADRTGPDPGPDLHDRDPQPDTDEAHEDLAERDAEAGIAPVPTDPRAAATGPNEARGAARDDVATSTPPRAAAGPAKSSSDPSGAG